jgi:hypothetical protein
MICKNGPVHEHKTVLESKICWGIVSRPSPPPAVTAPVVEPTTSKQLSYAKALGGDEAYAKRLGKEDCSKYIKAMLKAGHKAGKPVPVSSPFYKAPAVPHPTITPDPHTDQEVDESSAAPKTTKQDMILGLLGMVPDGYYAVTPEDGAEVTFMRLKRPKHGRQKGCVKVQTQHGPRLTDRWIFFPGSDRVWLDRSMPQIEDKMLLLIADWRSATKRYATLKGKCCRCNTDLTVKRSRHYKCGPECETHLSWLIEEIDEEHGRPFEMMPAEYREAL